jgi:hypothetical protein
MRILIPLLLLLGLLLIQNDRERPAEIKDTEKIVRLPPGTFIMGCVIGDSGCVEAELPFETSPDSKPPAGIGPMQK